MLANLDVLDRLGRLDGGSAGAMIAAAALMVVFAWWMLRA